MILVCFQFNFNSTLKSLEIRSDCEDLVSKVTTNSKQNQQIVHFSMIVPENIQNGWSFTLTFNRKVVILQILSSSFTHGRNVEILSTGYTATIVNSNPRKPLSVGDTIKMKYLIKFEDDKPEQVPQIVDLTFNGQKICSATY